MTGYGGDKGDSRLGDSNGVCLFLRREIAKGMGTQCSSDHGVQVVFASMSHLRTDQNLRIQVYILLFNDNLRTCSVVYLFFSSCR